MPSSKRVLIIDDEAPIREMIAVALDGLTDSRYGLGVELSDTCIESIEQVRVYLGKPCLHDAAKTRRT